MQNQCIILVVTLTVYIHSVRYLMPSPPPPHTHCLLFQLPVVRHKTWTWDVGQLCSRKGAKNMHSSSGCAVISSTTRLPASTFSLNLPPVTTVTMYVTTETTTWSNITSFMQRNTPLQCNSSHAAIIFEYGVQEFSPFRPASDASLRPPSPR